MPADRQDFADNRTDRPDAAVLPRVRDVLDAEVLLRGDPQVLVGGDALDAPVRWVHVSDSDQVAQLLDGGELLLTPAAGWPGADAALRSVVDSLADAGIAGIVMELGARFPVAPPALVACAAPGSTKAAVMLSAQPWRPPMSSSSRPASGSTSCGKSWRCADDSSR